MEPINEDIKYLEELIRKAYKIIMPLKYHSDLDWLMNKDARAKFKERFPKCFLSLSVANAKDNPIFPICNRTGMEDPDIIDFSLKLARKLSGTKHDEQATAIIAKLQNLQKKFSRDIPKPADMASKKAATTRNMSATKKYLKDIG